MISFQLEVEAATSQLVGLNVVLGLEAGIPWYIDVVVLSKVYLPIATVRLFPSLNLGLQILKMQLGWLETLVARNLCPQLVGSVLERVISQSLSGSVSRKELEGTGPYLLSVIELIVSGPCGSFVDVRPILVRLGLRLLFVHQVPVEDFPGRLTSHRREFCSLNVARLGPIHCSRCDLGLIVALPMLSAGFEHVYSLAVVWFSGHIGLVFVVCLAERAALEPDSGSCSPDDMLRVVVLGLRVFGVGLFVESMVVVEVTKSADFIGLAFGGRPDLVGLLQLLSLLFGGVGLLGVALEPSVADYFVNHQQLY